MIAVHDLEKSGSYYRDVLGFEVREVGDPGWRFFVRDQCFIMAGECPDALPAHDLGDHSYFAYLEVDDVDVLHEAVVVKGGTVIKPLRSEPWGMKEFGIRTIDQAGEVHGVRVAGCKELRSEGGVRALCVRYAGA